MTGTGRRRAIVVGGAAAQLVAWLLIRPDRAGSQWTDGTALQFWLGAEAVLAVCNGLLASDRRAVVVAILTGWLAQILHFAVLGEHYDGTLWGVGLLTQVALADVAVGLALVTCGLGRRSVSS